MDCTAGFRTVPMQGYALHQANLTLPDNFPPIHRLSFDDRRKASFHNTPVRSRALVSASQTELNHWAGCDQKPSPQEFHGSHCEKDAYSPIDAQLYGDLNSSDYPEEIKCYENAHSRSVKYFFGQPNQLRSPQLLTLYPFILIPLSALP